MELSPILEPKPLPTIYAGLLIFLLVCGPPMVLQHLRTKYKFRLIPKILRIWGVFQLILGLYITQKYYSDMSLFSLNGWYLALIFFVGIEVSQFFVVIPNPKTQLNILALLRKLLFFLIVIGFTEELWFRGIWFAMFKGNFLLSVVLGSIVFGLIHWPRNGFTSALIACLTGIVFAAARFRGASILPLAITHGLMDFLNITLLPGDKLRFSTPIAITIMVLTCLALAAIILAIPNC